MIELRDIYYVTTYTGSINSVLASLENNDSHKICELYKMKLSKIYKLNEFWKRHLQSYLSCYSEEHVYCTQHFLVLLLGVTDTENSSQNTKQVKAYHDLFLMQVSY